MHLVWKGDDVLSEKRRRAATKDYYLVLFEKQYLHRSFLYNNNKMGLVAYIIPRITCKSNMCPFSYMEVDEFFI